MLLHPGILALISGSALAFAMVLYASGVALKILRRWNPQSSSEEQLLLERKTYLVSTIVNYALGFTVLATLLFLFTIEDIHRLFVGAMCATGTLNANPVGWTALLIKIILFFVAALWVAVNLLDQRTEDTPLVRIKYGALLLIAPLMGGDLYLQTVYFLGLEPQIITSCCGSLFNVGGEGFASELAALPVPTMLKVFYPAAFLYLAGAGACLWSPATCLRYGVAALAVIFFVISLAAVVSFISLYIYQMPTHHCPFDMLQRYYYFVGYPLYAGLFLGTLFGLLPGLCQPLKNRSASLCREIMRMEKSWLLLSMFFMTLFLMIASWPLLFGNFRMFGY